MSDLEVMQWRQRMMQNVEPRRLTQAELRNANPPPPAQTPGPLPRARLLRRLFKRTP